MKKLKFASHLVSLVLNREKDSTWRLFDDKDLSVGDDLEFINRDTSETFGFAKITRIIEKRLGDIVDADFDGHEKFESRDKVFEAYREYYGDKVNDDSIVKMIKFEFSPKKS